MSDHPFRPVRTAVVLTAVGILATSCQSAPSADPQPDTSAAVTTSPAAPTTSQQQNFTYAWGDTATGPVRVTVGKPEPFITSATALPEGNAPAWRVDITFDNTMNSPFDPSGMFVDGYSDRAKGEPVFDSGVGSVVDLGQVAPGTSDTVTFGFTGPRDAARMVTLRGNGGSLMFTD